MKNFKRFLLENINNFDLSDNLKNILSRMNNPIAKDILSIKNLSTPMYLDVFDERNFGYSKTIGDKPQVIKLGRFINKNLSNYSDSDKDNFMSEYSKIFYSSSFTQDIIDNNTEYTKEEVFAFINSSTNYINEIDSGMIKSIIYYLCTEYRENNIIFYRGDANIKGDGFLINSNKTINQMMHSFNNITTEFISSELWKNKKYPLKKNSINITRDKGIANFFGYDNIYNVIPLDSAKIVCLPNLFGNYNTDLFIKEFGGKFYNPSNLAEYLENLIDDNATPQNINNVIKKLSDIYDSNRVNDIIYKNMQKKNMSFIDYMEYIFSPDNYDVIEYKNLNSNNVKKYVNFYTNQKVLMLPSNKFLKENITQEGRWGNIGAGILPYSKKTNRFLISLRSPYVLEPNTWGIWGGKLDDGDKNIIKKAAIREFMEETNFKGNILTVPSYIFRSKNFVYYNFIGIIEDEFKPSLDWETQDYKWVTLDELLKIEPKHFGLQNLLDNNLEQLKNL